MSLFMPGAVFLPHRSDVFATNSDRLANVNKGCMLVFCLTKGITSCVDSISELMWAVQLELNAVPVQIDSEFPYPTLAFYASVKSGDEIFLGQQASDTLYNAITKLLKSVFEDIALPFCANGNEKIIRNQAHFVVNRYHQCQMQDVLGKHRNRLQDDELAAAQDFLQRQCEVQIQPTVQVKERRKSGGRDNQDMRLAALPVVAQKIGKAKTVDFGDEDVFNNSTSSTGIVHYKSADAPKQVKEARSESGKAKGGGQPKSKRRQPDESESSNKLAPLGSTKADRSDSAAKLQPQSSMKSSSSRRAPPGESSKPQKKVKDQGKKGPVAERDVTERE